MGSCRLLHAPYTQIHLITTYFMPTHGREVVFPLRHAIVTCRLLYQSSWSVIEQKTGVAARTVESIVARIIAKVENQNFNEVLACVDDLERSDVYSRISDGSELSLTVRNSMLKRSHISSEKSFEKENISIFVVDKQYYSFSRSFLERMRKKHTHVNFID